MEEARFMLKKAGCIPYTLTEEEYDEFEKILKQKKTKELEKALVALVDTFGMTKTIEIVHEELHNLIAKNA